MSKRIPLRPLFGFISLSLLIFMALSLAQSSHAQPSGDSGGLIEFGKPIIGDLEAGEQDTWTFLGRANQRVSIVAERSPRNQSTQLDPTISFIAPDASILASDEDSGPRRDAAILGIILPQDGLYAIQVRDQAGTGSGTYQVTLAENFMPANCQDFSTTSLINEFYSSVAREYLRYSIYFPPCYEESSRRYPYLLVMHGSNSTNTHWQRLGIEKAITVGVALNRLPPFAVVMPYGGEIANTNTFYRGASYEYVILDEIMPQVEQQYCLRTDGKGHAIGGISRGGFWAWEIGLRQPENFTAIAGHSPVFDHYIAPATHNPLDVIATLTWSDTMPRLWIDRGDQDFWQVNIDLMSPILEELNIPHDYGVIEGGKHDDVYWASRIYDYLSFYSADWNRGLSTYPLCDIANGGLLPEGE